MSRVPKSAITERELRKLVRAQIHKHVSYTEWGEKNGITPQQISAFMCKSQGAGVKIPAALGYRPQLVYLPMDEEPIYTPVPRKYPYKKPEVEKPVKKKKKS